MPAVSPERIEAKNGLGLDYLAYIRSIAPVPSSPFRGVSATEGIGIGFIPSLRKEETALVYSRFRF
jgi:hypothetical protein